MQTFFFCKQSDHSLKIIKNEKSFTSCRAHREETLIYILIDNTCTKSSANISSISTYRSSSKFINSVFKPFPSANTLHWFETCIMGKKQKWLVYIYIVWPVNLTNGKLCQDFYTMHFNFLTLFHCQIWLLDGIFVLENQQHHPYTNCTIPLGSALSIDMHWQGRLVNKVNIWRYKLTKLYKIFFW